MIISQLATCEECRDGKCATCVRWKRRRVRLDADRRAKPRTQIVAHVQAGVCSLPGVGPATVSYEVRDEEE